MGHESPLQADRPDSVNDRSFAVPFELFEERLTLSRETLENNEPLARFVMRFRNCFDYEPYRDLYFFKPHATTVTEPESQTPRDPNG